jgi:hypothetical protein
MESIARKGHIEGFRTDSEGIIEDESSREERQRIGVELMFGQIILE